DGGLHHPDALAAYGKERARPRVEGTHLPIECSRALLPIEPGLLAAQLCRIRDSDARLGLREEGGTGDAIERVEDQAGAEGGEGLAPFCGPRRWRGSGRAPPGAP